MNNNSEINDIELKIDIDKNKNEMIVLIPEEYMKLDTSTGLHSLKISVNRSDFDAHDYQLYEFEFIPSLIEYEHDQDNKSFTRVFISSGVSKFIEMFNTVGQGGNSIVVTAKVNCNGYGIKIPFTSSKFYTSAELYKRIEQLSKEYLK